MPTQRQLNMASPFAKTETLQRSTPKPGSSTGVLPPISSSIPHVSDMQPQDGLRAAFRPTEERVNGLMKGLSNEVMSTESKIQDLLQSTLLNVQQLTAASQEKFGSEMSQVRAELERTRLELAEMTRRENALVKQQSSMSVEMVAEGRARKRALSEAENLRQQLASLDQQLKSSIHGGETSKKNQHAALQALQNQLTESERHCHEMKEKNSKLGGKNKKISEELEVEKNALAKLKKELADLRSTKSTDSRKSTMELSKFQTQLSAANQSLSAARAELEKLHSQLKHQQESNESAKSRNAKQHGTEVKALQQRIHSLEGEIESLHDDYGAKIAALQQQIAMLQASRSQEEDGLDPRMLFLVHQNRKEKSKIEKQRSKVAA